MLKHALRVGLQRKQWPPDVMTGPTKPMLFRPIRFTIEDALNCGWNFNCGPGALCAVLNLTPAGIRPLMGDFDSKGYTNPKLMLDVLGRAGAQYHQVYRSDSPTGRVGKVRHGLMRIQWGGPWTSPTAPKLARCRHTHWVAMRNNSEEVFDVNALCVGGWLGMAEWENKLVPWIIKECVPGGDGTWWPTHVIEVTPAEHASRFGEIVDLDPNDLRQFWSSLPAADTNQWQTEFANIANAEDRAKRLEEELKQTRASIRCACEALGEHMWKAATADWPHHIVENAFNNLL